MLFPDFQQHNTNVFSVLDNFEYKDGNKVAYLESATADSHVIGWHAQPIEGSEYYSPLSFDALTSRNDIDPLFIHPTSEATKKKRLDYCHMVGSAPEGSTEF